MKYDFDLDMSSENSLSLILRNIKPNSIVLEFGSAHGRMTKYLEEELNCDVYIVELDPVAGKEAAKYAKDFLVGDIEEYLWMSRFSNIRFDYIVFADVLEHLYYPQKVLEKSTELLKKDGSIFISIPNIAHNSIIIDLINNKFKYNEIGLLDNTHIRFFTYYSIIELLNTADLVPINQLATYAKVGETEFENSYDNLDKTLAKTLKAKEFGEVYQFIIEAKKFEYVEKNKKDLELANRINKIQSHYYLQLYLDSGDGFNEKESLKKQVYDGELTLEFDISDYKKINLARIDPANTSCIVKFNEIIIIDSDGNKQNINIINHNAAFAIEDIYIFNTSDPQIFLDLNCGNLIEKIQIAFQIYTLEIDLDHSENYLSNILKIEDKKNKDFNRTLDRIKEETEKKDREAEDLRKMLDKNRNDLEVMNKENQELKKNLEDIYKQLEAKITTQLSLEEKILKSVNELEAANKLCSNLIINLEEKEEIIYQMFTSKSWRLTAPLRKFGEYVRKKKK